MDALKSRFTDKVTAAPDPAAVTALAAKLKSAGKKAGAEDRIDLAAMLAHAAFLSPDRVAQIYDALATGWSGKEVTAAPIQTLDEDPMPAPEGLWDAWWAVASDAMAGQLDASGITQRTANLGGMMPEAFLARLAELSYFYPGVRDASAAPMPEPIKLDTLAACPPNSLGRQFHDLIVDNKFDLEVLDREALGLTQLPAPLEYLNTRMLQSHDLWHITAGYETTALHEIAISAFQMAQFGHNYSAQFLSIMAAIGARSDVRGFTMLTETIVTAWIHGRQTEPMLRIDWESEWVKPVDELRREFAITPYKSPYPANIIEKGLAFQAFIAKIRGVFGGIFGRKPALQD
ncbi:MAG: Coq4 family protein [Pseudomonadota bacterium]